MNIHLTGVSSLVEAEAHLSVKDMRFSSDSAHGAGRMPRHNMIAAQ